MQLSLHLVTALSLLTPVLSLTTSPQMHRHLKCSGGEVATCCMRLDRPEPAKRHQHAGRSTIYEGSECNSMLTEPSTTGDPDDFTCRWRKDRPQYRLCARKDRRFPRGFLPHEEWKGWPEEEDYEYPIPPWNDGRPGLNRVKDAKSGGEMEVGIVEAVESTEQSTNAIVEHTEPTNESENLIDEQTEPTVNSTNPVVEQTESANSSSNLTAPTNSTLTPRDMKKRFKCEGGEWATCCRSIQIALHHTDFPEQDSRTIYLGRDCHSSVVQRKSGSMPNAFSCPEKDADKLDVLLHRLCVKKDKDNAQGYAPEREPDSWYPEEGTGLYPDGRQG